MKDLIQRVWQNKLRIVLALLILSACVALIKWNNETDVNAGRTRYSASFFDVFDTQTEIVGYAESEEEFSNQVEKLKDELYRYHQLFDIYNDYEGVNNIKTINDNAGIQPVMVNQEIIELLKRGKDMYVKTGGKVNVAMGSVLAVWHDYREEGLADPGAAKVPRMDLLRSASQHMDMDDMIIDEQNSTVYLADPEMSLDVGGIGKGYAVEKVAEYARSGGIENMLISAGGNVCAVGGKVDQSPWKIGILDPNNQDETSYLAKIEIKDCSAVTSGDYQRYYTVDGVEYCHIIDPDTLMPANHIASVTIVAEESSVADALSTAVYIMPYQQGLAFVDSMDSVEAMWVMQDGSVFYSAGFEQFLAGE